MTEATLSGLELDRGFAFGEAVEYELKGLSGLYAARPLLWQGPADR